MFEFILFSLIIGGNFEKVYIEGKRVERVKGIFIYEVPHYFFIKVDSPLTQIVYPKEDTLYVYYPEDNVCFKLLFSKLNFPLGMNYIFFQFMEGDTLFEKMNLLLIRKGIKNDTVITEWSSQEKIKRSYLLKKYKNKLLRIKIKGSEKDNIDVFLKDYKELKENIYFPSFIKISYRTFFRNYEEKIKYTNLYLNKTLPDSIKKFKIPEETKIEIKDMRWKK
jgi:outer membrane lipoprotein-sorting protein